MSIKNDIIPVDPIPENYADTIELVDPWSEYEPTELTRSHDVK